MSKLFSPVKSSIRLTGQQCGGFQSGFSGLSFGTSQSSSDAFSSNALHASVGFANETGGNAPAAVAGAKAIMKLNCSILTPMPYYSEKNNDFKTWSNMNMQSDNDKRESKDDKQIIAAVEYM